jgi:hypothetical protein
MILFTGFTGAIDLGTFPQDSCVQIVQSCANCTYSNLSTVTYPNGTFSLLGEYAMTNNGTIYNYSYCLTSATGSYNFITHFDENGVDKVSDRNSFSITPSGESPTIAGAVLYVGLLIVLLVFFILILFYGLNTDNVVGQTFSIGFRYLFLIALFFVAWQVALNFIYSSPFLIDFFRISFFVLMIGFFPLLIILFAYGSYMMLQLKEIKDMQERGISIDEINERKFGAVGRY